MKRVLIIGLGYLGKAIAHHLQRHSYSVTGTTRSKEKLDQFQSMKLWPMDTLQGFETIIFSAGADNVASYEETYLQNSRLIISLLNPTQQLIYTSSTSVYGDHEGRFVTEETPLKPLNNQAKILAETEQIFLQFPNTVILRLGEIVGPGRTIQERLEKMIGKTVPGSGEAYTNLSYLTDIVKAIQLSIEKPLSGIYNVCSDTHLPRKELYAEICARKNWSPFVWDATQKTLHGGNKRVSSQKLKLS